MHQITALKGLKRHAKTLVSDIFSVLGANISVAEFLHIMLTWKEMCGQMANLVADSGGNNKM